MGSSNVNGRARIGSRPGCDRVLEVINVFAGYGSGDVIRNVSFEVRAGEIVALLGPNGAGKTTTLRTVAGLLRPSSGTVIVDGISRFEPLSRRARRGLRLVSEERSVFMSLSVLDNLRVADCPVENALALFPELEVLLKRRAGLLSGGEQQMLALACALGGKCRVCLIDELSLGLSEVVVSRLMASVRSVVDKGVGVVLVEQKAETAMNIADRILVLRLGEVVLEGEGAELKVKPELITNAYLS